MAKAADSKAPEDSAPAQSSSYAPEDSHDAAFAALRNEPNLHDDPAEFPSPDDSDGGGE